MSPTIWAGLTAHRGRTDLVFNQYFASWVVQKTVHYKIKADDTCISISYKWVHFSLCVKSVILPIIELFCLHMLSSNYLEYYCPSSFHRYLLLLLTFRCLICKLVSPCIQGVLNVNYSLLLAMNMFISYNTVTSSSNSKSFFMQVFSIALKHESRKITSISPWKLNHFRMVSLERSQKISLSKRESV